MSGQLTAVAPDHHAVAQMAAAVPISQIIAWIAKYGLPLVAQLAPIVLPLLVKNPDLLKLVTYGEQVLVALAAGQPIPPWPG